MEAGFKAAQAVVVLLTGDDEARLIEEFRKPNDPRHECDLTPQARANVLFEAGMAFGSHPKRTLLIELGDNLRPFSDTAGRHVIRFDGSSQAREILKNRLITAGCDVANDGRTDWQTDGDFTNAIRVTKRSTVSSLSKDDYVEANGVHWKRKGDGTFEKWAYCPTCHLAMSEFPPLSNELLICTKCNYQAPFPPSEVEVYKPK